MSTVIIELPLYTEPLDYIYGTVLEDEAKQLRFYWNSRSGQWHMDIRNEDQTEVVLGVPLVINYPILADHPMYAQFGLSGYFVLLAKVTGEIPAPDSASSVIPEFYQLDYVYIKE